MRLSIRASSVTNYADCPRRAAVTLLADELADHGYQFRRLMRGVGSAVGTGVHAGACAMLRDRKAGKTPNVKDATEISVYSYTKETESGVQYDSSTPNGNEAHHQIISLVNSFNAEIVPRVTVDETEQYREATLHGATITGHTDLRTTRAALLDWKFGAVLRHHHGQMGTYSLLERSAGAAPARLAVGWLPRVKRGKPYPGAQIIPYSVDVCERVASATICRMIEDADKYMVHQNPYVFSSNRASVICGEKYCPAWGSDWCSESR